MSSRQPHRAILLALPALAPLLPACAAPDAAPSDVIRRDSAGIEIVESLRPAWGDSALWRVDPDPLLDLAAAGSGPRHQFDRVRGMARLSSGALVVANAGSDEVLWFSAEGRFIGAAGGPGEGPGEFDNLQQIELAGDTVLALDYDETIAFFGLGRELVRTVRPRPNVRSIHFLDGAPDGGSIVARTLLTYPEAYGQLRYPDALLLYGLEGTPGDSIGRLPGGEEYITEHLMGRPLFPLDAVIDTHGASIFTGASDLMQVEELSAAGDTLRILRIPGHPLALTDAQVQAERDARLDVPLPQGMTLPPPLRQAIEEMPAPASRPAYDRMIVDPTGAVWLRPFRGLSERGPAEAWLVLGADGRWLGSVGFPADFRVLEIGVDEVLGVWEDEMDVQHPRVLGLSR